MKHNATVTRIVGVDMCPGCRASIDVSSYKDREHTYYCSLACCALFHAVGDRPVVPDPDVPLLSKDVDGQSIEVLGVPVGGTLVMHPKRMAQMKRALTRV